MRGAPARGLRARRATSTESTGGEDDAANDTFTFAQGADPRGLDPARVDDLESGKIIVEHLRGPDQVRRRLDEGRAVASPSRGTISADGLSYTFKLRQGVKFHDGTDFNADAVKFNIDRQLPPKVDDNMPYACFTFGTVKDVVVVDPYTVKINLTQKNTAFLANLAMGMAAPIVSPKALDRRQQQRHGEPRRHRPLQVRQVEQGRERRPRAQRRVLGREGQDQERRLPHHRRQLGPRSGAQQR